MTLVEFLHDTYPWWAIAAGLLIGSLIAFVVWVAAAIKCG